MAVIEKSCATCKYCVRGAVKRFRCIALPTNPGNYWDGYPEQHVCGVYWAPIEKVVASDKSLKNEVNESTKPIADPVADIKPKK